MVGVSTVGSPGIPAGSSADYDLKLANLGSVEATALEVEAAADTAPLTVTGAPAGLAAGELATARTSYTAPAGSSGTVVLRGTAAWQDARGNAYGLVRLGPRPRAAAPGHAVRQPRRHPRRGRRRRRSGLARRHGALHPHRRQPRRPRPDRRHRPGARSRRTRPPSPGPAPPRTGARSRSTAGRSPSRCRTSPARARAASCFDVVVAQPVPRGGRPHRGPGHRLGDRPRRRQHRRPGAARLGRPDPDDRHPAHPGPDRRADRAARRRRRRLRRSVPG